MPLFLSSRACHLAEAMDDPGCDPALLERSYRQFRAVNSVLSRSRLIYERYIRPLARDRGRGYTLLDIGFGGGDIARGLARWAARDGLDLRITGIDIDPRALDYVRRLPADPKLSFRIADIATLVAGGERFDFVLSNHLVHHLDGQGLEAMLGSVRALATRLVVFNDIRRSDLAYLGFWLLTAVAFRRSYIRHDGLLSIRRSYTATEMRAVLPEGWELRKAWPFRLLLIHRSGCS
jgi:2-polyprenyl-3-methyl-5-hydroxy-6-metoxy-1,4-benzoquinol methylase